MAADLLARSLLALQSFSPCLAPRCPCASCRGRGSGPTVEELVVDGVGRLVVEGVAVVLEAAQELAERLLVLGLHLDTTHKDAATPQHGNHLHTTLLR